MFAVLVKLSRLTRRDYSRPHVIGDRQFVSTYKLRFARREERRDHGFVIARIRPGKPGCEASSCDDQANNSRSRAKQQIDDDDGSRARVRTAARNPRFQDCVFRRLTRNRHPKCASLSPRLSNKLRHSTTRQSSTGIYSPSPFKGQKPVGDLVKDRERESGVRRSASTMRC